MSELDKAKAALDAAALQLTNISKLDFDNRLVFFTAVGLAGEDGKVHVECVANCNDPLVIEVLEKILARKKNGVLPASKMSLVKH